MDSIADFDIVDIFDRDEFDEKDKGNYRKRDYAVEVERDQRKLIRHIFDLSKYLVINSTNSVDDISALYDMFPDYFCYSTVYGGKLSCADVPIHYGFSQRFSTSPLGKIIKKQIDCTRSSVHIFGGEFMSRDGFVVLSFIPEQLDRLLFYSKTTVGGYPVILTALSTWIAYLDSKILRAEL